MDRVKVGTSFESKGFLYMVRYDVGRIKNLRSLTISHDAIGSRRCPIIFSIQVQTNTVSAVTPKADLDGIEVCS